MFGQEQGINNIYCQIKNDLPFFSLSYLCVSVKDMHKNELFAEMSVEE